MIKAIMKHLSVMTTGKDRSKPRIIKKMEDAICDLQNKYNGYRGLRKNYHVTVFFQNISIITFSIRDFKLLLRSEKGGIRNSNVCGSLLR